MSYHHHHYHDLSGINWLEEQHPLTDFKPRTSSHLLASSPWLEVYGLQVRGLKFTDFKPPVEIIEFVHSFATLHGFYTFCSADSVA